LFKDPRQSIDIGLKFSGFLSPDLWIGTMIACFQSVGTSPELI